MMRGTCCQCHLVRIDEVAIREQSLVSAHHRQISVEQQAKLAGNFQQDNAYSEWWCDSNG